MGTGTLSPGLGNGLQSRIEPLLLLPCQVVVGLVCSRKMGVDPLQLQAR